ncbi:hypothetical protein R1flu_014006 [Riccia fluitans]|uniref:HMG box domain-containing protein n=1 Tax=Riccia fluitans TaxID=41844 RepID=A0ABD1YFL2_9MARC
MLSRSGAKVQSSHSGRPVFEFFSFVSAATAAAIMAPRCTCSSCTYEERLTELKLGSCEQPQEAAENGRESALDRARYERSKDKSSPDAAFSIGTVIRCNVTGVINDGFLISAIVPGQDLPGVLSPVARPPNQTGQVATMRMRPELGRASEVSTRRTGVERRRYTRHKRRRAADFPKKSLTAYNFYFAEERGRLRKTFPDLNERQITQAIGFTWKRLSVEEKKPFMDRAVQDKERYAQQKYEYNNQRAMFSFGHPLKAPTADRNSEIELDTPTGDLLQQEEVDAPSPAATNTSTEDDIDGLLHQSLLKYMQLRIFLQRTSSTGSTVKSE